MLRNGTRWCISDFNVIGEELSKKFEVSEQGGVSKHRVSDSTGSGNLQPCDFISHVMDNDWPCSGWVY